MILSCTCSRCRSFEAKTSCSSWPPIGWCDRNHHRESGYRNQNTREYFRETEVATSPITVKLFDARQVVSCRHRRSIWFEVLVIYAILFDTSSGISGSWTTCRQIACRMSVASAIGLVRGKSISRDPSLDEQLYRSPGRSDLVSQTAKVIVG